VAAGRRSDGMALFAGLCHFAGFIGSHEATVSDAVEDRLCLRNADVLRPSMLFDCGHTLPSCRRRNPPVAAIDGPEQPLWVNTA
jgi:hypothetical protein